MVELCVQNTYSQLCANLKALRLLSDYEFYKLFVPLGGRRRYLKIVDRFSFEKEPTLRYFSNDGLVVAYVFALCVCGVYRLSRDLKKY